MELAVKFNVIPKTLLERFSESFPGYKSGLVKSEPGNFVMTPLYGTNAEKPYRLQTKREDVWLSTFPKSGRTFYLY